MTVRDSRLKRHSSAPRAESNTLDQTAIAA